MRRFSYLIAVFLLPTLAFSTVRIAGVVIDRETGAPLVGAHLQILNTNYFTVSDADGSFSFSDVPPGEYSLISTYVGYKRWEQEVEVYSEGIIRVQIALQAEMIALEETVVEVPALSARVYDSEKIRSVSAKNLAEFLQTVGEALVWDGGGAQSARISIRGSKPEQVTVLLDGHRLNDPRTGECDLKALSLNNIEKVVVKPNSEVLNGAITPGGTIELFSGEEEHKNLSIAGGSFGLRSFSLNLNEIIQNHRFDFNFAQSSAAGDFKYHDANGVEKIRLNDDFTNRNFYLKYSRQTEAREISASYHIRRDERGAPGGIENPATMDRINRTSNGISFRYQNNNSEWRKDIRAGYFDSFTENLSFLFWSGDTLSFPSHHRAKTMEFDAQLSHNRTGEGMVVGTAYRKDAVVSSTLQGNTTRDDIGIYFQRTISRKQFHISNGLRADFYRGYGSFISGGNSIRWRPFKSQPFHILGNWNRGFNLPTFNELFWAEDVFAAPNPDLKPEKSESFDIGGELVNSSWNARITYFRKYIKDMIVWQESYTSSGKKWKPFNNDAALIKGVELFGQFSSKITDISLSATLSNPRNKSQDYYDNYLVFQPRLQTMESMEIKFPPVEFRTSHRYLSRRYTLPANTKWVEPVHICDLSSAVEFPLNSWKIRLSTGIDNLFDEEYSIISESPMPGRGYRVEILFEL